MRLMSLSYSKAYLRCSNCDCSWTINAYQYYNGGFIERKCPRCNMQDTSTSLKQEKSPTVIQLLALDWPL